MASTSDIVARVADRNVKRLTAPLEAALRAARARLSESALAAALAGGRERAMRLVDAAIDEGDLRVLAAKEPMEERLLDVAQESADATRCAVRPTTTPAEQAMRNRPAADAASQVAAGASEQAARSMIGQNTVPVTADIKRALDTTPQRRVREFIPPPAMAQQAIDEAARVARFDTTQYTVRHMNIADLSTTEPLVADSELVVRYRTNLPVPPVVVNQEGVILDGRKRVASAWASGYDKIYAVQVRSDDGASYMEWLRWNN